jgi:hypothetical protein
MIPPRFRFLHFPAAAAVVAAIAPLVHADDRVPARDGSGILGYKSTPVLPWCGFHVHDPDRPAPPRVDPGPVPPPAPVPADAIVLFNGRDLEGWRENRWRVDASEIVGSMRARKARMADLADAFIALPGGIGTLEEFMEIWTLNQLGEMEKPAGLLDVAGYYQPFLAFIDHMIDQRFLPPEHRNGIVVAAEPDPLIEGLMSFRKVTVPKWM